MTPVVRVSRVWWTPLVAACMLCALPAFAGGQTKPKPAGAARQSGGKAARAPARRSAKAAGRSTLSGVYTNEQANRGRDVYEGMCRSCHTPESHTGAVFVRNWRGKTVADLFTFVSLRMPKNDPGTMAAEDVADLVAYLLKMNAMPVGRRELYPDPDSLTRFRIEVKPSSRTSTPTRTRP